MANRLFTFVGLLALSGTCTAGVSTYAFNPFLKTYAATPSAYVKAAPYNALAPIVPAASVVQAEEIDPHPQYEFAYNVHDSLTGDIKNQIETRDGDNVAGAYSIIDADGYKRTVSYTADDVNGFNAVVQREPIVAAAPVLAQASAVVHSSPLAAVQATPVVKSYAAAPLLQAAPVFKTFAAAPVVHVNAAPLVQGTPVSRAFAATPVVHATPVVKTYPAAPVVRTFSAASLVQPAPLFRSYAAAPIVQAASLASNSYLAYNVAQEQPLRFPLQQQVSYFGGSPAVATQEPINEQEQQHGTEDEDQKETQQFLAAQPAVNEPTPIEYPQQQQQPEDQQKNEQEQDKQQQEQTQLQQEFEQQQQLIQEQQQLFAEQQQQFAAQQQQVILQQQQLVEQQQQYFQQQFPSYPQQEVPQNPLTHPEQNTNTDSEIVEARSTVTAKPQKGNLSHSATLAPAPVNEEQPEADDKIAKKSA